MVDVCVFLVVSESGKVRVTKGKPPLRFDEIAMRLQVVVPKRVFDSPLIQAKVVVDEALAALPEIAPEVVLNTAAAIEQATGMKVELKVLPAEPPRPCEPVPASPCASCAVEDCDPVEDPCDERKAWSSHLPVLSETPLTESPE
ncbi:MAG: hypothetical protein PHV99_03755 [Candidatus Pacebacteria bacterium]|nr:hypothetical protein [Candidatus Paceibacterota bacterium]